LPTDCFTDLICFEVFNAKTNERQALNDNEYFNRLICLNSALNKKEAAQKPPLEKNPIIGS